MIQRPCPTCRGIGWVTDEVDCPVCNGSGHVGSAREEDANLVEADTGSCPVDHGDLLMLEEVWQSDDTWYRRCPHCGWIDVRWTAREYSKEALKGDA